MTPSRLARLASVLMGKHEERIAHVIHAIIFFTIMLIGAPNGAARLDFMGYFDAARKISSGATLDIYDFVQGDGIVLYRYFPTFATMLVPLLPLGLLPAFVVFSPVPFVCSILASKEAVKIARHRGVEVNGMLVLFLCSTISTGNYMFGNSVPIATFLVMLSFRLMVQGRVNLAGVALGLSIVIKPIALFIVYTMLLSMLTRKEIKKACTFAVFLAIPLIPDVLFFLTTPGLTQAFLQGSVSLDVWILASLSATALPVHFGTPFIPLALVCVVLFSIPIVLLSRASKNNDWAQACTVFTFGTAMHFVIMTDVWYSQVVALLPLILLSFMATKQGQRRVVFKFWVLFQLAVYIELIASPIHVMLISAQVFFTCFWLLVIRWQYKAIKCMVACQDG